MMAEGVYFQWVRALRQSSLPAAAKNVGCALALYADSSTGRRAHPGIDRLVADTGLSAKTVQRSLAALVDAGLIVQTLRGGSRTKLSSEYGLVVGRRHNIGHHDRSSVTEHRSDVTEHRSNGAGTSVKSGRNIGHCDAPSALISAPASAPRASAPTTPLTLRNAHARASSSEGQPRRRQRQTRDIDAEGRAAFEAERARQTADMEKLIARQEEERDGQ